MNVDLIPVDKCFKIFIRELFDGAKVRELPPIDGKCMI